MTDTPRPDEPPAFGAHESHSQPPALGTTGDQNLPPIEPPSARFIIQLFVVPALIVMFVVAIWIVFSWLVHRTTMQPEDLIEGLKGSSVARWQRASELADVLRDERFTEFRGNSQAARQLAEILDRELDDASSGQGGMDEQAVTLRYFLSRALGEFRVDDGTDVLLKAATTSRDPSEQIVRRGALQALAVRAFNLSQLDPPRILDDPAVLETLSALAVDENPLVRSETAFALGQIGTPAALERLDAMLVDAHADTRYNAAVALAQHGSAAAIPTLAEMLDPAELASAREAPNDDAQFAKRSLIATNAIRAIEGLAKKYPTADFTPIREVLEQVIELDAAELQAARFHPTIVPRAKEMLASLPAKK